MGKDGLDLLLLELHADSGLRMSMLSICSVLADLCDLFGPFPQWGQSLVRPLLREKTAGPGWKVCLEHVEPLLKEFKPEQPEPLLRPVRWHL